MSKREPFSDRLTPEQVQQVLDRLGLPWREYYNPDNKGWVNMPNDYMFSDLSVNIHHGGFVNQHADGMIKTYNSHDYLPARGDLVTLVMFMKFGMNDEDKAIQWIKQELDMDSERSTVHSFNVKDAIKYGAECAVLLYNIRFWLDKNLANNSKDHINEGRIWTYNSANAFAKLFPYLSAKQIYRRLKNLEDEGILLVDHFHDNKWKRANWYSLDEDKYLVKSFQCISRNRKMHSPEPENRFS